MLVRFNHRGTGAGFRVNLLILVLLVLSCAPSSSYVARPAVSADAEGSQADATYHYSLAIMSLLSGNVGNAVKEYEAALSYDPKSGLLATELATIYIKTGQHQKAIELCEKALQANPANVELHLLLGGLYLERKNKSDAEKEFRQAIKLDPSNVESYLYIAIIHLEGKRYDEALKALKAMMKISPDNVLAVYYTSKAYLEMKSYGEAEKWLKKTIALKPSFESAWLDLGGLYELQNKNDQAIETYKQYSAINPSRMDIKLRLAKAYLRIQQFSEASAILEEVRRQDSTNREVRFTLGLSYFFKNEKIDRAIEEFSSLLEEDPKDERVRYFLACSYEEKRLYDNAMEEFQKIPADSDLHDDALIHMATILKRTGKPEQAISMIAEGIKASDKEPSLYSFLSSLYQDEKKFKDAEEITKKGLSLFPNSTDLHYRMGAVYEGMNRFPESIKEMEEVLKLDPNHADAMNFIGYSYAERGINLDKAEELINKALKLKPGSGYIIDSLGWLYFRQDKFELALKYLRQAASLLPDDPTVLEHLGDASAKSGQVKEALEAYKRALQLNPSSQGLQKKIEGLIRGK
jgi:tetratricopeptide (TPR) repeat protein